ncbi:helix-turn-helix domain-containing protein [Shimia thalassica]|uniref:excisionase family DNA-binding protein n=1 Tax=Shimia thalassica TaxID=1715693 RepID=UPI0027364177|nr:helix-turn-helix domain-containing protein [Shimia thalassica]MDP2495486.1 helix-turn-helix domain-containing protein [Shimia thalassica]
MGHKETLTDEPPIAVTPMEFGRRLNISKDQVYQWWKKGYIKGLKVGRRILIPTSEIDRIRGELEALPVKSAPDTRNMTDDG